MGELQGVTLRSSEVKQDLLQLYHPDNWTQLEEGVLAFLKQQLGAGIETLTIDIASSAHPGPLLLKFTINSRYDLSAAQLKQALRR